MPALLLILIEYLELIALLLQPFYRLRQGGLEFVNTLQRVVEGNYRTISSVSLHILKHLVGREAAGIVASDKVPHYDCIVAAQADVLAVLHPAPRRTEQV